MRLSLSCSTPQAAAARGSASWLVLLALFAVACSGCGGGGNSGSTASGGNGGGGTGGSGGVLFGGGTATGSGGAGLVDVEFVQADKGAFGLGDPITGDGVTDTGISNGDGCEILVGVVRDFKGVDEPGGHPDFQAFVGDAETPGLVAGDLGADSKPIYASQCEASGPMGNCPYGPETTSKDYFDQWYRFADGVNKPYLIYFQFADNGNVSTFESTRFFPLDDAGWGMSGNDEDGFPRNFHFTTELHTKFEYKGGETFRFSGDDDLWVFINGKLAIDLGGLHPSVTKEISLDDSAQALGIQAGNVYSLELFHAERRVEASNFRVDTNLAFVDCGTVLPDPK